MELASYKLKAYLRLDAGVGQEIPPDPCEQDPVNKRTTGKKPAQRATQANFSQRALSKEDHSKIDENMLHFLLSEAFARREPWATGVEINGHIYGGSTRHEDWRLEHFAKTFPHASQGRVLELGALEGALSLELSKQAKEVLGLEARPESVERASFIKKLFRKDNLSFDVANLEEVDLTQYGDFDVIFCCGLLYHLPNPRTLVERMVSVSPNLYLDTHYAPPDVELVEREGVEGWVYTEGGWEDPRSGVSGESFWPTLDGLKRLLSDSGYDSIKELTANPDHPQGPRTQIAASVRFEGT